MDNISFLDEVVARTGATKLGDLQVLRRIYSDWYRAPFGNYVGTPRQMRGVSIGRNVVAYDYHGRPVRFHFDGVGQLRETLFLIAENFEMEQYGRMDIKGRMVLDVGASIGDTAMYFALNGAGHVYAIEPFPYAYRSAKRNIGLNGLGRRITLLNQGIASKQRDIVVDSAIRSSGGSKLRASRKGSLVHMTTIKSLAEKYGIDDGILKMDCEGGEYDALLGTDTDTLRRFGQMSIEYHHGYINLQAKLEGAGFKVAHTMPRMVYYDMSMRNGLITATRQ